MITTLEYLVRAAGTGLAFICHFISNFCGLQQRHAEGRTVGIHVLHNAVETQGVCANMVIILPKAACHQDLFLQGSSYHLTCHVMKLTLEVGILLLESHSCLGFPAQACILALQLDNSLLRR